MNNQQKTIFNDFEKQIREYKIIINKYELEKKNIIKKYENKIKELNVTINKLLSNKNNIYENFTKKLNKRENSFVERGYNGKNRVEYDTSNEFYFCGNDNKSKITDDNYNYINDTEHSFNNIDNEYNKINRSVSFYK